MELKAKAPNRGTSCSSHSLYPGLPLAIAVVPCKSKVLISSVRGRNLQGLAREPSGDNQGTKRRLVENWAASVTGSRAAASTVCRGTERRRPGSRAGATGRYGSDGGAMEPAGKTMQTGDRGRVHGQAR